jgi:hypothetical protein
MPGLWNVTATADGARRLDYFDFTTRKSWCCGTAPARVSRAAVVEWVVSRCHWCDLIVDEEGQWAVVQPYDETNAREDTDAPSCEDPRGI